MNRKVQCIWVDGSLSKACRVLRARLEPLGYRINCKTDLWDTVILELARFMDCIVVTTDKFMALKKNIVYIPQDYASRKSARDLASHITKLALGR